MNLPTESEVRDRLRKGRYALMMQLDWMKTTNTPQEEAIKVRLERILAILDGND